jgi:hypothetical protein
MDPKSLIDHLKDKSCEIKINIQDTKNYKEKESQLNSLIDDINGISKKKKKEISEVLMPYFYSVGSKSSLRGIRFNKIVSSRIKNLIRRKSHITFETEKKHKLLFEKVDWVLYNKRTKKTLIGFNQIDLWGGGHQINRGSKYVLDTHLHQTLGRHKIKLVNVVLDAPKTLTVGTKKYNIVNTGVQKKRLFTLKTLSTIIREFIDC